METVHCSAIVVPPERQRREFNAEKLGALASSILEVGLLQPLVVRNDGVTLVAGERRLTVLREQVFMVQPQLRFGDTLLPEGHVPVIRLSDLNPQGLLQVEFAENEFREPLTWHERVAALAAIAQAGREEGKSMATVAAELRETDKGLQEQAASTVVRNLSEASRIAEHLHRPEVAGAKSARAASRVVDAIEQEARVREALKAQAALAAETGVPVASRFNVWLSSFQKAPWPEDVYADLIIADPPYGIDADTTHAAGPSHTYQDDFKTFVSTMKDLSIFIRDKLSNTGYAVVWFDIRHIGVVKQILSGTSLVIGTYPLVWNRQNGAPGDYKAMPVRRYETALLIRRTNEARLIKGFGDVLVCNDQATGIYGAEKPPALYAMLYESLLPYGGTVFDPCCGSGPSIAALPAAAKIYACDINEQAVTLAKARVKA